MVFDLKKKNKYGKKGLSLVIATILLMLVAILSVVAFQLWFGTFQSDVEANVETKTSDRDMGSGVEHIVGSFLYFRNTYSNISIQEVSIDGNVCSPVLDPFYTDSIVAINVSDCLLLVSKPVVEVVVYTDKSVYSKFLFLK